MLTIWNGIPAVVMVENRSPLILQPLYQTGAQGPTGAAGPPGANGAGFTFDQAAALDTWTINHNLGYRPSVDLFTSGGMEMIGQVLHTSLNQTVVSFNGAVAGTARLN